MRTQPRNRCPLQPRHIGSPPHICRSSTKTWQGTCRTPPLPSHPVCVKNKSPCSVISPRQHEIILMEICWGCWSDIVNIDRGCVKPIYHLYEFHRNHSKYVVIICINLSPIYRINNELDSCIPASKTTTIGWHFPDIYLDYSPSAILVKQHSFWGWTQPTLWDGIFSTRLHLHF